MHFKCTYSMQGSCRIRKFLVAVMFIMRTKMFAGVKSLYYSCVDYVVEKYCHYYPQLHLLPPRIQSDICQERDKRANRFHHIVATYNYVTPFTVINFE